MVTTMAEREVPGGGPPPERATRGMQRRIALLLTPLLIVVCVGGALFMREWVHAHAHPRVFPPLDVEKNEPPTFVGPAKLNQPYHVGFDLHSKFEISAVTPIMGSNSAPAATAVTVCRGARTPVLGAAPYDLAAACNTLEVPNGVYLGPSDYVVVTIVPLRSGTIDLQGVRVSLRDHSRRWHENTGFTVRLNAR